MRRMERAIRGENSEKSTLWRIRRGGRVSQIGVAFLALLIAVACGAPPSGGPAQTGSLSVLATDAPSDDYAAINLTIEKIELLSARGGPVTVSEESLKFDLLRLRNVSELLLSADDVPVGHYEKIRLLVTEIELISADGSTHYADIPANGKVDLLPRGGFDIDRDEDLTLEIDIDADKSIQVRPVGWGGRYRFRPVVFVRHVRHLFDGRIVRLHGHVENLDPTTARFDLCHLRRPLAWLQNRGVWEYTEASDASGSMGPDHQPPTRCRRVELTDPASIFDAQGEPTSIRALSDGDELTAIGRMAPKLSVARRRPVLHGELVLLGAPGTFRSYRGFVAGEVDADDRFALEIAPGQGFAEGSVIDVQLYGDRVYANSDIVAANGTKLYSRSGMAIERTDIALDLRAAVTGILFLSNVDPDTLRAALVILDLDAIGPAQPPVAGVITDISSDPALQRIRVQEPDQPAGSCVDVPQSARIVRKSSAEGGDCREGEYADLAVGDQVSVYGRPSMMGSTGATDADCFDARVIVDYGSTP